MSPTLGLAGSVGDTVILKPSLGSLLFSAVSRPETSPMVWPCPVEAFPASAASSPVTSLVAWLCAAGA